MYVCMYVYNQSFKCKKINSYNSYVNISAPAFHSGIGNFIAKVKPRVKICIHS